MRNIIDYVENEFHTINEKNFNPVDSLILSQVTNYFYDDIVPNICNLKPPVYFKDLLKAEYFNKMFKSFIKPKEKQTSTICLGCLDSDMFKLIIIYQKLTWRQKNNFQLQLLLLIMNLPI